MDNEKPELWGLGKYTPGGSEWEKHNGMQVGDTWVPANKMNQDVRDAYRGLDISLYPKVGGGYTRNSWESAMSIDLDADTGDITINAPSSFLNSKTYKESIAPALETISLNYKVQPDYKYALLTNSDKTKTSQEWLEEINKELPKLVKDRADVDKIKAEVKNESGVDLTDEQVVKMSSIALDRKNGDEVVKVTDDTIQMLPKRIRELAAFKNLQGWDEGSHGVKYKDLMESWDREKTSDEDIIKVYNEVADYFQKGDFSDPDEYAEMIAFSQFINGRDPNVGFWRGVGDHLSNAFYGILTGAAQFDMNVLSFIEGSFNFAGRVGTSAARGEWVDEPVTGEANFVRDYLQPTLTDLVQDHATNSMRLNDAAGTVFNISNTLTPILMQYAVGDALGKAAAAKVSSAAIKALSKTGEAGLIAAAEGGAAAGMTAEKIAIKTINGTNFLLKTASKNVANGIVAGAIKTLQAYEIGAKAIKTIADVGSQIIVDCVLTDAQLFRQFMEGDSSDETKAYLMNQAVQNATGWMTGVVAGAALKGIANSKVGRFARASVTPKVNRVQAWIGQRADDIKVALFHHGDVNWNQTKADKLLKRLEDSAVEGGKRIRLENRIGAAQRRQQNLTQRRIERIGKRKIGELGGPLKGATSWGDVYRNVYEINKKIDFYSSAAHLLANKVYTRDLSAKVSQILNDNPTLNDTQNAYLETLQKVLKREDADGLARMGKVMEIDVEGKPMLLGQLSKSSNDYVNGVYRLRQAQIARPLYEAAGDADIVRAIDEEIGYFEKFVADFKETHSDELVTLLDELEIRGRAMSGATQDARVQEGVLDAATLAERRESGFFSDGYMRQQRAADWDKYHKRGGELHIGQLRDDQHIVWGLTKDGVPREYQDLTFVLFDDVNQMAKQVLRKEMIGYLDDLGVKVTLSVSGEEVQAAKTVNGISRKKVFDNIDKNTGKIIDQMGDSTTAFDTFYQGKTGASKIATAEKEVAKSGADITSAAAKAPKIGKAERIAFVNDLDIADLDELVLINQAGPFGTPVTDEESFKEFYNALSGDAKAYMKDTFDGQAGYLYDLPKTKKGTDIYTYENFQKIAANDPDFITNLKRRYVIGDKKALYSNDVTDVLTKAKQEQAVWEAGTVYKENTEALEKIKASVGMDSLRTDFRNQVDDFIDELIKTNRHDSSTMKALGAIGDPEEIDDLLEYAVLKNVTEPKAIKKYSEKVSEQARKEFKDMLMSEKVANKSGKMVPKYNITQINDASIKWGDAVADYFETRLNQRYGRIVNVLKDSGSDVVDYDDLFGRIDMINKEITNATETRNIVKTFDSLGREEYVKLSPTVADLITTMPTPIRRSSFGELQQTFARVYRMGLSGGLVPKSLINQWFRDTGAAVTLGDATKNQAEIERILVNTYGDTIAEYYKEYVPDVWETLLKKSDETGESIEKLAVQREMSRAGASVGTELESKLYDFTRQNRIARNQDGIYDESVFDNMKTKLEKFQDKTETLNNIRERHYRVSTYDNAYLQALNSGHSVPMARRYAEMIQAEATTNFGRQSYHLANLTHTVPYLGSAINGAKSFWRLWSLDPVGVTTRITAGYVVPMIALTNASMSTKENLEVYKQIPEYEKKDHLVFVLNGQKMLIPVPQEVSSFIAPIRSMVEYMHGANDHSFDEIMANDLVGFSPLNLEGFVNVDSDRILSNNVIDGIWKNHLLPGFSKLSSSMMPPLVKSGVMYVTGYDPFTGKEIDTSYTQTDPETGESVIVDHKSGTLAKMLGNIFGEYCSAPMAQAILNSLIGTNNSNIIDGLIDVAVSIPSEEGILGGATKAAQRFVDNAVSAVYSADYGELSNQAWNRAVAQLYREKDALLNDPEYVADLKALSKGDLTEEAQAKILGRIKTKREEFQERVLDASKNLIKEYDGTLDMNKFGSVLSLMTFTNGSSQDPTEPLAAYYNKQDYQLAKAKAIETMQAMGFTSPSDKSMFGYYGYNKDTGEIAFQMYSPLAILNFDKSTSLQDDISLANIREAINEAKLWDAHKSVTNQINSIYGSKKKLTKDDKAKIEAIQINWNAEVAKTIMPYVSKMTAENAINNTQVRNYLYSIIEVPSSWEVNDKGKSVYLGKRGNKKAAYYDSWIKSMFGVNDRYKGQY